MKENLARIEKNFPTLPTENEVANDSRFDVVTDYVIPQTTPKEIIESFPLYDVNDPPIIADFVFAETPLKERLSRADFEPPVILKAQLEAQAVSPDTFLDTIKVVADVEFARHERLNPFHFTRAGIEAARRAAQGIRENPAPSQHYIDTHTQGRINTNQEVPRAQIKPIEQYETELVAEAAPKYTTTVYESTRNSTPEEYKSTGNLINHNATRLDRSHFPKGAPEPLPIPKGVVSEEKPSLLKRLVPGFLKRFFK